MGEACHYCDRPAVATGKYGARVSVPLCGMHYQRHLRGGDMSADARPRYKGNGERLLAAALRLADAETAEEYEAARRSLWVSARVFTADNLAREAAKLAQCHDDAREWLIRRGLDPATYRAGDCGEWIDVRSAEAA